MNVDDDEQIELRLRDNEARRRTRTTTRRRRRRRSVTVEQPSRRRREEDAVVTPPIDRAGGVRATFRAAVSSSEFRTTRQRLIESNRRDAHCAGGDRATRDRYCQPTLRRAWPRECSRPQCAFKMSMFNVSCNSHYFTQLAALFIDTRAE